MSNMQHFPKYSIVKGGVKVELNLDKYSKRFEDAQWFLGEQVLHGCRAVMPLSTGSLQQRSGTEAGHKHLRDVSGVLDGGRKVIFPGPYARYQYMGRVMVDRETGKGPRKIPTGPGEYELRFRKGAKLMPTDRKLKYSTPQAVDHWFDEAKKRNERAWIEGVKRIITEGKK